MVPQEVVLISPEGLRPVVAGAQMGSEIMPVHAAPLSYHCRWLYHSKLTATLLKISLTILLKISLMISLTMLLGLAGCGSVEEETSSGGSSGSGEPAVFPEQQFYDYTLVESHDGVKQWLLESDIMQKFPGDERMHLVAVDMTFYRGGIYHSTLIADSGRAHTKSKAIHVWGSVVVTTNDGRKLETEELFYDNERDIIYNDVFDRLTREYDVVTGIGMEAKPDLTDFTLKQRVQGEVGDGTFADGDPK